MANALTPLEQHVEAIKVSLAQNKVDIQVGEIGQHEWGSVRRILFEPQSGTLAKPDVTGKQEILDGRWGKAFRLVPLRVTAHVVAESHTALWVLWNNVVVASSKSLKLGSVTGDFNLNPESLEAASHLFDGAEYLTQDFVWNFYLFNRVIDLPDYAQPVESIVGTSELVPLQAFTNTVQELEPGETIAEVRAELIGEEEEP
jgi:hypothetical protein